MSRFLLTSVMLCLFALPTWARSEFAVQTVLRRDALQAGYTIINPAGTARVGVPAKSIKQVHKVRVKLDKVKHPENYYGDDQPKPFLLNKALWLGLSYPSTYAERDTVIKYYDPSKDKWRPLRRQRNNSNSYIQSGQLRKKQGIIAVFEKPLSGDIVQGI